MPKAIKPLRLEPHDIVDVLGVRGSGKTYWTKRAIVAPSKRVVVWDPHGEYDGLETLTLDELALNPDVLDREQLRVRIRATWENTRDVSRAFEQFAKFISTGSDFTLVIDEVGLLTRHATEAVEFIACQSRHWGMPVVFVAQRARQIPVTARDQASIIIAFRQYRPEDVAALRDRMGERADRLSTLPRFEHVAWHEADQFQTSTKESA